jgi:peptidoglycan hydrolase CwlO-like protein
MTDEVMEQLIQVILQGGALGILIYLVIWTTRDGAPKLFQHLSEIKVAITRTGNKLDELEEKQGQIEEKIDAMQHDVSRIRVRRP